MGGDSLMTFHFWKDWKALARMVPIAVVARPGFERAARVSPFAKTFRDDRLSDRAARILPQAKAPGWVYLPAPLKPISSTLLRGAGQ